MNLKFPLLLAALSAGLLGTAHASTLPEPSRVMLGAQQIQVPPGADAAVIATKAWAQSGKGQVIMDDDTPLYPHGLTHPTLVCAPGFACSVRLNSDEQPLSVVLGNPAMWQSEVLTYGHGRHVITVRALDYTGEANMLINTDRRTYTVKLKASRDQYVPAIGWYYPKEQLATWVRQAGEQQHAQTQATQQAQQVLGSDDELPHLTASDLNFRYYQEGRDYTWKPVRVYDDGKKTFIEMNPKMQVSAAPVLVIIDADGREQLVNYRVKGNYFVVDRLFDRAALLNGVGRGAERVEIYRGEPPRRLFGLF